MRTIHTCAFNYITLCIRELYIDQPSDVFTIDWFVWLTTSFQRFVKLEFKLTTHSLQTFLQDRTGSWVILSLCIFTSIVLVFMCFIYICGFVYFENASSYTFCKRLFDSTHYHLWTDFFMKMSTNTNIARRYFF